MRRFLILMFTLLLMAETAPLCAQNLPVKDMELRYDVWFGGIPVGELNWVIEKSPRSYSSQVNLLTSGLMKSLTKFKGQAAASGDWLKSNWPRTNNYLYQTTSRSRGQNYGWQLADDKKTAIVPGNKRYEDRVPENLRSQVTDPLSALTLLRELALQNDFEKLRDLTIPVYDGRRRYDVAVESVEEVDELMGKGKFPATRLRLKGAPLAGVDEKDFDRWKNHRLDIYFSRDDKRVPLQLVLATDQFIFVLNFKDGCVQNQCGITLASLR
ncbi:MAG: DUF3108 domain-containing protein [Dongiaceae bacterium]